MLEYCRKFVTVLQCKRGDRSADLCLFRWCQTTERALCRYWFTLCV